MERVQVEEMDEGKMPMKRKKGIMAMGKNVMQGCGKETRSLADWAPKQSK